MMGLASKLTGSVLVSLAVCAPVAAVTCEISPQSVSFDNYDTLAPQPLDGIGNIAVICDSETTFTISLDSGSGSYAARRMSSGTQDLGYNLDTDASRMMVWGDGSAGSGAVTNTGRIVNQAIYGRIAPLQFIAAGTYGDQIVVTISY